jgi:crotonobetainyl-CoA:carnitine CoA-transferase CaiB-like acyl-CoA transferase
MTLGDLGAEVWKIECPGEGDDSRKWSPPSINGVSSYFLAANRNKLGLAVDLATPEGRAIVLELAALADVVIENFRPSSIAKLDIDYDALKAVNPRLIHCSISGYGRDNAFADRPGYDFVIQAESGFMSLTGDADGHPQRLGVAFIDLITGMNATQAILAALYARERTGVGQSIDIALFDSALHLLANASSAYLNTGKSPQRMGNAHPSIAPYQMFETADAPLALAVGNDEQFRRLCTEVMDLPELWANPDYRKNVGRVAGRTDLIAALQSRFLQEPAALWIDRLQAAGVPVGQIQTVAQAFTCPAAMARDVIVECDHPVAGRVRTARSPLRFSGTPTVAPHPPPMLGQHTRAILRRDLDYAPERIDALIAAGVVAE